MLRHGFYFNRQGPEPERRTNCDGEKLKSAPPFAKDAKNGAPSGQKTLIELARTPRDLKLIVPDDFGFLRRFVGSLQETRRIAQRGDL